jgi:hypothetical protein
MSAPKDIMNMGAVMQLTGHDTVALKALHHPIKSSSILSISSPGDNTINYFEAIQTAAAATTDVAIAKQLHSKGCKLASQKTSVEVYRVCYGDSERANRILYNLRLYYRQFDDDAAAARTAAGLAEAEMPTTCFGCGSTSDIRQCRVACDCDPTFYNSRDLCSRCIKNLDRMKCRAAAHILRFTVEGGENTSLEEQAAQLSLTDK